jgi:hypothetical protein
MGAIRVMDVAFSFLTDPRCGAGVDPSGFVRLFLLNHLSLGGYGLCYGSFEEVDLAVSIPSRSGDE